MGALDHKLVFAFAFLAVMVPVLRANIADFDEVWQKRAEEAKKAAMDAYEPDPDKVAEDFNQRVHE